jgi:hypothetical protein
MTCECDNLEKSGQCLLTDREGAVLCGDYFLFRLLTGKQEIFSGLKLVVEAHGKRYEVEERCSYEISYKNLLGSLSAKLARDGLCLPGEEFVRELCPTEQGLDLGL